MRCQGALGCQGCRELSWPAGIRDVSIRKCRGHKGVSEGVGVAGV